MAAAEARARLVGLAIMLLGLLVAALAGALSVQLATTFAGRPIALFPLGQTYDVEAVAALPKDVARARALTEAALKLQPANAGAWLRLAVIDAQTHGRLTPDASTWLGRSYEVAPYDPRILQPRLRFSYDHWGQLSPELQAETLSQVRAVWSAPEQRTWLTSAAMSVSEPSGRLAISSELFRLRMMDLVSENEMRQSRAGRITAP